MSIDAPQFEGEQLLSLTSISQAGCANPACAFDNYPATAATFTLPYDFVPRAPVDLFVPGTTSTWIDTGIVLAPGDKLQRSWLGTGDFRYHPNAPTSSPSDKSYAMVDGTYPATNLIYSYNLAMAVRPDGAGPPGSHIADGIGFDPATPTGVDERTIASGGRVWVICNDNVFTDNSGGWNMRFVVLHYQPVFPGFTPIARYVRADWGEADFVTRVRLKMSGEGAINAGIAFVSGFVDAPPPAYDAPLTPTGLGFGILLPSGFITESDLATAVTGADVPIPYIPLPSDDNSESGVDEITIDVPQLATGVIFYPDYLAASAEETGDVSLYQIQIYAEKEPDMANNPPQVTTNWSQVGVQGMIFYPWNGPAGPYDNTTASKPEGLQSLSVGTTITTAKITGGETQFQLGAFETGRELKFKFSVQIWDLRLRAVLEGGTLRVNPAAGQTGEVQYYRPDKNSRNPYFRFAAWSDNGDGKLTLMLFKCKLDGSLSGDLNKDNPTNLEGEFTAYWDRTAVCQDGAVGGIQELIHGSNGEDTFHS